MSQPALILAENKEWEKGAAGVCWFGKPEGRRKTEDGRRKTVDFFFFPMNRDTESDGLEAFRRSRKRHKPTETVAPLLELCQLCPHAAPSSSMVSLRKPIASLRGAVPSVPPERKEGRRASEGR